MQDGRVTTGTVLFCDLVGSTAQRTSLGDDAASDALSAAIAIQQSTELRNRSLPAIERLVLRIRISAGDVHYVANDCRRTPVVDAARLEAEAEAGAILVSDLVRLLAGSRGDHRFDPVGFLELKGLPTPIETRPDRPAVGSHAR